jgi:hypothetical protein
VGFIIMNVVGREQVKLNVENEYPVWVISLRILDNDVIVGRSSLIGIK